MRTLQNHHLQTCLFIMGPADGRIETHWLSITYKYPIRRPRVNLSQDKAGFMSPNRNIPALVNHIRTLLGEEELIEFVRHTLVIFSLADCGVNT